MLENQLLDQEKEVEKLTNLLKQMRISLQNKKIEVKNKDGHSQFLEFVLHHQ